LAGKWNLNHIILSTCQKKSAVTPAALRVEQQLQQIEVSHYNLLCFWQDSTAVEDVVAGQINYYNNNPTIISRKLHYW
jgi:hypothetical protein